MGPWEVLALGAKERDMGVLVRSGTGAGCFPFDMGGVGSELAWVGCVLVRMAGLVLQAAKPTFLRHLQ